MNRPTPGGGIALALSAACFYGFNITFARIAAFAGIAGPTVIAYRVMVMLALAGAAALVWRHVPRVAPGSRGATLALSLASSSVGLCYISSVAFIPVTVAAVVFYTFPVLIVLVSPFVNGTRLTGTLLAIAATAFVGVVLVVGPAFDSLDPRGLVLAAGASLSAVVQFNAANRAASVPTLTKVIWVQMASLPTSLLAAAFTVGLQGPSTLMLAPVAIALTVGGFLMGFVLNMMALARISAVVGGLAFCAEPVVASLTSAAVLGERLTVLQYFGGMLVIAAIVANVLRASGRLPWARPAAEPA
jgi:drug/metabolite transporter (DMT)-like permease